MITGIAEYIVQKIRGRKQADAAAAAPPAKAQNETDGGAYTKMEAKEVRQQSHIVRERDGE
jgi:hypothetical protein